MTIETYFETLGAKLEAYAKTSLSTFLSTFIQTDIGKMALDAVTYAATLVEASGDDKKEAAKTQLLNDAVIAGKDLSTAGSALLNFFIETALQALTAGLIAAV